MNKLYRRVLLLFICLLNAPLVFSDTPESPPLQPQLQLRLSLQPEEGVVGQQHRLRLELLTSTWFHRAPVLPSLQLEGVVTLPPQSFATNFTIREGGQTLAGQAYEYLLFPQRSGLIRVPSLAVTVWSPAEDGRPLPAQTLHSEPLVLQVKTIPGQPPAQPLLVAEAVSLEEQYDPFPERLRQGDAVSRRIDIRVQGTPGMLIPPVKTEREAGEFLHQSPLQVSDQYHRGQLKGQRSEQLTYVLPHAGEVKLGDVNLRWWNSKQQRLETLRLPGRTLQVLPRTGKATSDRTWMLYLLLIPLVCIGWLFLKGGCQLRWQRWQQRRQPLIEKQRLYRSLLRHCRQRDADSLLRAFYRWQDLYSVSGDSSKPLADIIGEMKRARFSRDSGNKIPYDRLYTELKKLQMNLNTGRVRSVAKPADLAPLYPGTKE